LGVVLTFWCILAGDLRPYETFEKDLNQGLWAHKLTFRYVILKSSYAGG